MGWELDITDLNFAGGGYVREDGENYAAAKAEVTALGTLEKDFNISFYRAGGDVICLDNGTCRGGVTAGIYGVPGILGTFAGVEGGVNFDLETLETGDAKGHAALRLGVLGVGLPGTPLLSLEVGTPDITDPLNGVAVFLTVGFSIETAVTHSR